jgi:hypothetical protein
MRAIDRKKRLFENVLRLRRAERAAPSLRDVVAVRAALEEELGETISQRLAASLLGISHTALRRWIESGDLPVVYNADGREQVPVSALLDLREAVDRERASGRRSRHLIEPVMIEARAQAQAIDPATLLAPGPASPDAHERANRRSLAYHRAVAKRLRRPMVDDALHLIWTWREQGRIDPRFAERWEQVLRQPVPEIRRIVSEDSPAGRDLRQNSPFAGALSEAERRKILAEVR